jgi:hypothetical protein
VKIKLLKLTNNLDILCEVVSETEQMLRIRHPIRVVTVPNKAAPAAPTVGFAPWVEYTSDDIFTLDKSHVMIVMNPITEFVDQYNSMFSKIIVPSGTGRSGGLIY